MAQYTAEMVATYGLRWLGPGTGVIAHAIKGEFKYDRTDNRTMCGRLVETVQHRYSGKEHAITCDRCIAALDREAEQSS